MMRKGHTIFAPKIVRTNSIKRTPKPKKGFGLGILNDSKMSNAVGHPRAADNYCLSRSSQEGIRRYLHLAGTAISSDGNGNCEH
jgi:hypothetical protein